MRVGNSVHVADGVNVVVGDAVQLKLRPTSVTTGCSPVWVVSGARNAPVSPLVPHNPTHQPITVDKVTIQGRVIGLIREM